MSSDGDWLDSGDNAWQLTAASLVGLQSVPGLLVLYAGLMKRKWAVNSAFMVFYAFSASLIIWVLYAYKMAFGEQWIPICGKPDNVLGIGTQLAQSTLPAAGVSQSFPLATMVYYQFVFCAITLVILAGAVLGRMNFLAWMVFVPLWITFSYTIVAFSVWGGGFLFQKGVLDFAGGYVIHLSSGTAGFIAAAIVGPRSDIDREDRRPNNTLLVMVGAGLLWIGWNGFNGGGPFAANADAGVAVLNTNITTAMSVLTWTILDIIAFKKPSLIGAVQGMITGLVAITPAAGFIAGWGAIIMGFLSGSIPWVSMNIVGKKVRLFRHVDDTLGIFHTHFVAAWVGGFMTGILATVEGCAAFGVTNPGGAIAGNGRQVWVQIVSALFVIAWNLVWTPLILYFIKFVLRIPLRMSLDAMAVGDDFVHGEDAYVFDDVPGGFRHDQRHLPGSGNLEGSEASQDEKKGHNPHEHVAVREVRDETELK